MNPLPDKKFTCPAIPCFDCLYTIVQYGDPASSHGSHKEKDQQKRAGTRVLRESIWRDGWLIFFGWNNSPYDEVVVTPLKIQLF
jgi:hypothetical protein